MKTYLSKLLLVLLPMWVSKYCISQPGTLDSSFGVNGKTVTVGPDSYGCHDIALKKDGKFVTIGNSSIDWTKPNRLIVAQYLETGKPDSTFGTNGKVLTVFNFGASIFLAASVIVQSDGKIVAGGSIFHDLAQPDHFVLVRYLTNGVLDSSFGNNGIVFTYIGPYPKNNYLSTLYLQDDGKILAGGYSSGYCLIKYNSNGSIDSSFAQNGIFSNRDDDGMITDLSVQKDGKILIAGGTSNYIDYNSNFKIIRLQSQGNIDSTFGINGVVQTDFFGGFDQISAIEILQDGNLLTNGVAYNTAQNNSYAVLAKYQKDGKLDSSFATNGKLITQTTGAYLDYMGALLIQEDGKILSTGIVNTNDFYICRYNKNGSQDSSFGLNGKAIANFETISNSYSAVLENNGKIIVGGGPDFRIARFKGDEPITVGIRKNLSVTEGNTGTTPAQFKVILNKASTSDVFVNYSTKNLNALVGSDYTATSGTLRIKAGKVAGNIVVPVIADNAREANERFALLISNPVNAVLGTLDSATCTIKNDDPSFTSKSNTEDIKATLIVQLYPNPVIDVLHIAGLGTESKMQISILDMNGQVLAKKSLYSTSYAWNIKSLPAGAYFLKIESQDKTQALSFIKQ